MADQIETVADLRDAIEQAMPWWAPFAFAGLILLAVALVAAVGSHGKSEDERIRARRRRALRKAARRRRPTDA